MKKIRLRDVADVITKGTTPTSIGYEFVNKGINFIKVESITEDGAFIENKFAYITDECNKKLSRSQLQENDILFSIAGAIGRVAIVDKNILPANTNQALAIIRLHKGVYEYNFLKYILKSPAISKQFEKQKQGVAQINLSLKNIGDFEIPVISIEQQKKIADEFDKVTVLIDKRKRQLEKLDELVKSRFIEMFGDPNSNEKEWTVSTLGEYMTLLTDFSANGSYELLDSNVVMYDEPNYAVMVRTTDLEAGNLTDGVKYIDRTAYELLSKSKLYGGELIMNKIGSAGKIYIMPQIDKPASLGRNAFMFRFDDRINMVYLYALLSSDYGTKEIQQYVRGAVTKTITKESTRSIRVIVPPIELQEQYATFVEQVDKSKFEIKQSLEKLELLKKALMQKYFG